MSLPTWLGGTGFAIGDFPFGQDTIGRDIFARTMKGVQTSLIVMSIIGVISTVIGIAVGAMAGFYRGSVDQALMRFTDLIITFPVFVYVSHYVARDVAKHPIKRLSPVRRWLTYLTLFVAATVPVP